MNPIFFINFLIKRRKRRKKKLPDKSSSNKRNFQLLSDSPDLSVIQRPQMKSKRRVARWHRMKERRQRLGHHHRGWWVLKKSISRGERPKGIDRLIARIHSVHPRGFLRTWRENEHVQVW